MYSPEPTNLDMAGMLEETPKPTFVTITRRAAAFLNSLAFEVLFDAPPAAVVLADPKDNRDNYDERGRAVYWEPAAAPAHVGARVTLTRNLDKPRDFVNGMTAVVLGTKRKLCGGGDEDGPSRGSKMAQDVFAHAGWLRSDAAEAARRDPRPRNDLARRPQHRGGRLCGAIARSQRRRLALHRPRDPAPLYAGQRRLIHRRYWEFAVDEGGERRRSDAGL